MENNPAFPHRRSLRLKGYDYSQAGAYFVTICAHDKKCLFGEVMDGEMRVNKMGEILAAEWEKSAEIRVEIEVGPFVVMPNHFHGIIFIVDADRSPLPNRSVLTAFRRGDRLVARSEPAVAPGPQFDRGAEGNSLPPSHRSAGDPPVAPTMVGFHGGNPGGGWNPSPTHQSTSTTVRH